ncbi:MAG TPA: response regulator, partial [Acidisoma sp.]|nr:response regulator [Acidisoma sp.]
FSTKRSQPAIVLVVDDEASIRMLIVDVLRDLGYVCIESGDSASALSIMHSAQAINVLITDVGLPGGVDGRQLARAGREIWPDLRVLLITGYADTGAMMDHLEPGTQMLMKPFALEALTEYVDALCPEGVGAGRA